MAATIIIRVDGNSKIGFGHLVRTKVLAAQLVKRGAEVIFLSRDTEKIGGFPVIPLETCNQEELVLLDITNRIRPDLLIIDSYDYTGEMLNRIGQADCLSVYIDDTNLHRFTTDYVINGNLYAPKCSYKGTARLLLGPEYLIMREEFADAPTRHVSSKVRDILVTFGAADLENATLFIMKMLLAYARFSDFLWHVVIGPVFSHAVEIETFLKSRANVILHHNPNIKKLMDNCDISISAAGSTVYELAACGVPSLLCVVADNQEMLARTADEQGIACNLGWYHDIEATRLFSALDRIIFHQGLRADMAARGQSIIDGRGAERLADILLNAIRRKQYGY